MPAAVVNQIQLSRNQIATLSKDPEIVRQLERLIAVSNLSGFGQATVSDVVLDATGHTFSLELPRGRYFVDLVVMVDVVGGSGSDGFTVEDASTATISAGNYAVVGGEVTAALAFAVPRPGPYAFNGATSVFYLRGVIDVQQPGAVGFRVVLTGAPTSATLLAGSGLTTTLQRGVQ